ncbi:MAG: hypothetical protein A2176_09410 [Spirochaetes bacterium RBG_13_51_14]|nr:MAG: hypothetical protein A2176_09410 [Spirochaetes bacterium RBG_13_51_14]
MSYRSFTMSIIKAKKQRGVFLHKIVAFAFVPFLAFSQAGCNGKVFSILFDDKTSQLFPAVISSLRIVSLSITPATPTVPSGVPQDFNVTATLGNGKIRALTENELERITWSWDPSGSTTLLDITSVDIQNIGINNLPRVTPIKSDYNGGDEEITLTANLNDIIATAILTINDANLVSINVTPGTASITRLATQQFTANGTYTDGSIHDITDIVNWDSSNDTIATVDALGKATGQYNGAGTATATITADDGGSISDFATLDVTAPTLSSVSVSPITRTIAEGTYVQFSATAIYSNNTTQDVTDSPSTTWQCLTGGIATIDYGGTKGLARGDNAGTTTVRATFDGINGDATLEVSSATMQYLVISAAGNKTSIADSTKLQFTATGVFSDNSTQDLTDDPYVAWGSTDPDTAAFEFLPGDPAGLITAVDPGATVVSATYDNGVDPAIDSQDYDLVVTSATLSSITISPQDPIAYVIAYGTTQQFTVTGTFSDLTTQDLTTQVDWFSSNETIASIDANGLASTTISVGITTIRADYPRGGTMTHTDDTDLQVISMPLISITITPSSKTTYVGETFQYAAMGTFDDGSNTYNIDITNLVLWSSDDTNLNVSNSSGNQGLATPLNVGDGSATVTASRGAVTSNSSVVTIAASDTTASTMMSAQLLVGDRVKVTFSEAMDYTTAMVAANYKVLTSSTVTGSCSTGDNLLFENNTGTISISSVAFYTQSVYILQLGAGTSNTEYTVIGDRDDLRDVAGTPNALACPSTATFTGIDTVDPYLVSIVNSEPTKIIVNYSEPMTTGGGTSAADNSSNYTLTEDPTNGIPEDDVSITSITTVDESTFILNLDKSAQSIQYKLTVNAAVTDLAPTPNPMGAPLALTFMGNEQLKVVSAEAIDLTHVKVTFSKPVLSGNDVANSAECDDATECHTKYKLFPRGGGGAALLGDITSAVRGSGNKTNTVVLTHANDQEGYAYTVVAANDENGDGFDDEPVSIKAEAGTTDYMQASPKDRATFIGLGEVIDSIDDGEYFTDPFADGSVFTWSFVYGNRVYLGTNDHNSAAFRFDPTGLNSVLVTFDFVDGIITSPLCPASTMYGYGATPVCGTSMGYNGERGVVGFTSATVTVSLVNYEILMIGPIKDGVTHGYFTQDIDTQLDWTPFGFSVTGGNNTKSIQTLYAVDNHLYLGFSSNHNQQAPIVSHHTVTAPGGIVSIASGTDMGIRSVAYLGKQGSPSNSATYVGIDTMTKYNGYLYMANNGGIRYSSNFTTFGSSVNAIPSTQTGTTLWLEGLEKVSPGHKGVPILMTYNGKLYMARNVTDGSPDNYHQVRGELWKCDPATTGNASACDPGDWTRIISGTESDLGGVAISLLQNNGAGRLYVGFDNPAGVTVWRIASTDPPATSGSMASAGWVEQGLPGLNNSHIKLYSSATINDGTYDYIYLTAGDDTNSIRVYRQRE